MTKTIHPLVRRYLRRLDQAAHTLPRGERKELVAEIRAHIDAGLASPDPAEAEVRNLLDGLGTPEEIVRAAVGHTDGVRPARMGIGWLEGFALLFLVTGFPPVIGWAVGAVLMTGSSVWKFHHKLLGMLVWPGGWTLFLIAPANSVRSCSMGSCEEVSSSPTLLQDVGFAVFLAAPLLVAVYLVWVARRHVAPVSG